MDGIIPVDNKIVDQDPNMLLLDAVEYHWHAEGRPFDYSPVPIDYVSYSLCIIHLFSLNM
jgi:hypothetical protein